MGELRRNIVRFRAENECSPVLSCVAPAVVADFVHDQARQALRAAATKDFIDELYVSAIEFHRLPPALLNFARAFEADEACLFAKEWPTAKLSVLDRAHAAESHVQRGCHFDSADLVGELERQLARADAVLVDSGATVDGGSQQKRSAPADRVHYLAIAPDAAAPTYFGVAVARRERPFSEGERDSALALVPDVRRAFELRKRASRIETVDVGIQMFDQNPIAIIVARQRAIERANASAVALLASGRPIGTSSGKLRFEDSRAHAAFDLLSRSDAQTNGGRSFAFVVEGAGDGTWIVQLSHARLAPGASGAAQPQAVLVALTPFNAASQTRETMLNGFTDLTPTERTIFAAFVDGQDVASIAQRLNRSVETVRWHVRNLFTKLGVNSQADLARLGALLLPI